MPTEWPLAASAGNLFNPSVSPGGLFVGEAVEQNRDLWRAPLAAGQAAPFIRSTHDDYDAAYAPDGEAIAFFSERSGTPEIWIEEHPGAEPKRMTDIGGAQVGARCGRRMAHASRSRA